MVMTREDSEGIERDIEEENEDGRTTFNQIKGMKVYDADGEKIGHVSDVEINQATLNPTKLMIHKGFFGEYLRVNLKYIDKVTRDGIYLWISPARNLVGYQVLDVDGTEMGEVREAEKDQDGNLEYIRVETRIIRTREEDEELEAYALPSMSFEDMSITLPASPMDEGPIATHLDVKTEEIYVNSEDIVDVGKDCIRLKGKKERYMDERAKKDRS